jgi:cytochrome b561
MSILYKLVMPFGIATYLLLWFTASARLLKWKLKYHKYFAWTTITLATIHASLVITIRYVL